MKYIMGVVVLLLIATVIFILLPQPEYEAGKTVRGTEATSDTMENAEKTKEQIQADQRHADMQSEFERLARSRRDLEQKLNKVKVVLWDLKLPEAEGEAITEIMKSGYGMLKNPRLLGAYSSVEEISSERARINYLYGQLQDIEDKYRTR